MKIRTRRQRTRRASPIGLLAVLAVGCQGPPTGPPPELQALPRPLTSMERAVVSSSNRFAFDLLHAANAGRESENLFVSPLSVSMALGMAMNGAATTTFEQMRHTLAFGDLSQEGINSAYRGLLDLLLTLDPDVETAVGNSVWYRQELPVRTEFLQEVQAGFDGRAQGLDFADPGAPAVINDWVREVTRGRIDGVVESIGPLDVMYLVNAIYFDGRWRQRFDRASTRADVFDGPNGELSVQMMNRTGSFPFFLGEGFTAVELAYGNGAFVMTVLLPEDGRDVNDLFLALDPGTWQAIVNGMSEQRLMLSLPRFRIEYEESLVRPLRSMGMVAPFTAQADFSRMSTEDGLYLSEVKHKSVVRVDETGTEAAAATAVTVSVVSAPPAFRVDRPFVFLIHERLSGTILFAGKVVLPEPIADEGR